MPDWNLKITKPDDSEAMTPSLDNRELISPKGAHRIDEAALNRYLASRITGFEGNGNIRQFLGGQSNPTFLIDDASGQYVLRKKPPGSLLPSAHAVDREFRIISALQKTRVPVPKTYFLCQDDQVIGQMFYVMEYVSGRVIDRNDLPGCEANERTTILHSMAQVFGVLHSIDYQNLGLGDFGRPTNYVARQVSRWTKQYEASSTESFKIMDQLIDWLKENNPEDEQSSIVHGDFRPGNMIFHNEKLTVKAVLDWELSTIGHPLADLGYFLVPYRINAGPQSIGIKGLDLDKLGIPTEQSLLETYSKFSGQSSLQNIDYYIAFAMFRLAAILAGVLRRGLDGNAADPRAIERGQLYKQLTHSAWAIASKA